MENNNNYCVYIHHNRINNKSYIGLTKNGDNPEKRWGRNGQNYKNCTHFWNAIQKYKWDNFEHIIWAENLSEDKASHMEKS